MASNRNKMSEQNYDFDPTVSIPGYGSEVVSKGWDAIARVLWEAHQQRFRQGSSRTVIAIECYPGVHDGAVREELSRRLETVESIDAKKCFKSGTEIESLVAPDLGGEDPIFGFWTRLRMVDFLDAERVKSISEKLSHQRGLVLVVGPAASLIVPRVDVLVYADMPRWEGQLRQRRGEVDNLGVSNRGLKASLQYKRSFFIDWRVADRHKCDTMERWDWFLDTTLASIPKLLLGDVLREGLAHTVKRPFRLQPFFDPGPWGGQWIRERLGARTDGPNLAWGFDCVPEENSLVFAFGEERIELPAQNLVFAQATALLGAPVESRFGREFPIRFDLLDTIRGGNLSLQVHPTTEFAREHFGLWYTQDESYYMLEALPGAEVFLGRKNGTDLNDMFADLEAAQRGEKVFDDRRFVGRFPARKHDHFLIPAGTLHCSGAGGVVLEISATPYIFTFKLWDWQRVGLDGLPRPVNLERGKRVIDWSRDERHAASHLVNCLQPLGKGAGWRAERTGLHVTEFIETHRHWFTASTPHSTHGAAEGSVNVLNLVEGEEAIVESPDRTFEPFVVHYAETFVVPAAVGDYVVRPYGASEASAKAGHELATLKARVRV